MRSTKLERIVNAVRNLVPLLWTALGLIFVTYVVGTSEEVQLASVHYVCCCVSVVVGGLVACWMNHRYPNTMEIDMFVHPVAVFFALLFSNAACVFSVVVMVLVLFGILGVVSA